MSENVTAGYRDQTFFSDCLHNKALCDVNKEPDYLGAETFHG